MFDNKNLARIAAALERLLLVQEAILARQYGVVLLNEKQRPEEGEILVTDPEELVELERKADKYGRETGIQVFPGQVPGALDENGNEWPATAEEIEQEEPEGGGVYIEEVLFGQGTARGSSQGLLSVGPEGAESDEEAAGKRGSETGAPAGHIPR